MLYQINKQLETGIQKWGCYFLCLVRMAEEAIEYEFSAEQANMAWNLSYKKGYINYTTNKVDKPDLILRLLLDEAKSPIKIFQVGAEILGHVEYWQWAKTNEKAKAWRWAMEKIETSGEYGTHFRLCNREKIVTYDPYSPVAQVKGKQTGRYTLWAVL